MERHDKEMDAIYLEALEKNTPLIEVQPKLDRIKQWARLWARSAEHAALWAEIHQDISNRDRLREEREAYDASPE